MIPVRFHDKKKIAGVRTWARAFLNLCCWNLRFFAHCGILHHIAIDRRELGRGKHHSLSSSWRAGLREHRLQNHRTRLTGHVHPSATAENEIGPVESAEVLSSVTVALRPSAEQDAQQDQLIGGQQDSNSPNYHKWLTPEEYADRFVVSADDISRVTD